MSVHAEVVGPLKVSTTVKEDFKVINGGADFIINPIGDSVLLLDTGFKTIAQVDDGDIQGFPFEGDFYIEGVNSTTLIIVNVTVLREV